MLGFSLIADLLGCDVGCACSASFDLKSGAAGVDTFSEGPLLKSYMDCCSSLLVAFLSSGLSFLLSVNISEWTVSYF